ncbi:hypothetical protein T492DRAFT_1091529 [Pavlovales sp. CCMP2436]|nr:hypothetical protein T492DRAFT_1091529 [Pavlovales sp. CCMP2436]
MSARVLSVVAAVAVCLLFGSSQLLNSVSRRALSRSSISFTNFTLDVTPQQFYGRLMSRSTINQFYPFTSPPLIEGLDSFGPGAITLPIFPVGYFVLYDLKWEYTGSVFTSAPAKFTYKACFTHRKDITKAIAKERCLVTLSDTVELEPTDATHISIRRTVTDMQPHSPLSGILANLVALHMELHHHVVLKRDWVMPGAV